MDDTCLSTFPCEHNIQITFYDENCGCEEYFKSLEGDVILYMLKWMEKNIQDPSCELIIKNSLEQIQHDIKHFRYLVEKNKSNREPWIKYSHLKPFYPNLEWYEEE